MPDDEAVERDVKERVDAINAAWREGRPQDMAPLLHPEVTIAMPGFAGSVRGAERVVQSFVDFCASARVIVFQTGDLHVDVVGRTAIATYPFVLTYEREGQQWTSRGRDLWAFERAEADWRAVWRGMVELREERVD